MGRRATITIGGARKLCARACSISAWCHIVSQERREAWLASQRVQRELSQVKLEVHVARPREPPEHDERPLSLASLSVHSRQATTARPVHPHTRSGPCPRFTVAVKSSSASATRPGWINTSPRA